MIFTLTEIIDYFEGKLQDATCQTAGHCVWCDPVYKKGHN